MIKTNQRRLVALMALVACHEMQDVGASRLGQENDEVVQEDLQVQTFAEAGVRFVIPCRTKLCESYLKKLNPSNDWLVFKNDGLDTEDAPEPSTTPKKKFPHGSKFYGHVQAASSLHQAKLGGEHRRHQPSKKAKEVNLDDELEATNNHFIHRTEAHHSHAMQKDKQEAEEEARRQAHRQRKLHNQHMQKPHKKEKKELHKAQRRIKQEEAKAKAQHKHKKRDEEIRAAATSVAENETAKRKEHSESKQGEQEAKPSRKSAQAYK